MSLASISRALASYGIDHVVVSCDESDAKSPPRQVKIKFKSSSERARARREAKQYRLRNKSKLRLKAKKYAMKMKHRKPNPILSKRAKQIHKKYGY